MEFTLKDFIDIIIVAFLIYELLILIKNTRGMEILKGIIFLFLFTALSYYFELTTLYWILHYFSLALVVAIPIVFQPELRRALEYFGRQGLSKALPLEKEETLYMVKEITKAVNNMAKRKIGAIIILERLTGLDDYIEKGTYLDAKVSSKLLECIFEKNNPLHDGAIVIRNNRIIAAEIYLPLSDSPYISDELGTRHRAALGISEESDCIAIVVSEETGMISIAHEGKLTKNLKEKEINQLLISLLSLPKNRNVFWKDILRRYGVDADGIFKKKS